MLTADLAFLPGGWSEKNKDLPRWQGGETAEDTVQVQVKETGVKRGGKNVESSSVTAHFEVQDAPVAGSISAETEAEGNGGMDADVVMGDEDAEGEDE